MASPSDDALAALARIKAMMFAEIGPHIQAATHKRLREDLAVIGRGLASLCEDQTSLREEMKALADHIMELEKTPEVKSHESPQA